MGGTICSPLHVKKLEPFNLRLGNQLIQAYVHSLYIADARIAQGLSNTIFKNSKLFYLVLQ